MTMALSFDKNSGLDHVNRDFRIFLTGSFVRSISLPFWDFRKPFRLNGFFSEIRQFPDFQKPSNSAESLLGVHTGLNESQGRLIVAFSIPVRRDTARYFIYVFKNVPSRSKEEKLFILLNL